MKKDKGSYKNNNRLFYKRFSTLNFINILYLIMLFSIISCNNKSIKINIDNKKNTIEFFDKYIVCDTCKSVILVHHDECTFCGEMTVDSGTVYLTNKILKSIDTLASNTYNIDTSLESYNKVSLNELYFSDSNYYFKLWKDSINFKDWYKVFRLTGQVTELKRRILSNGIIVEYPSLFFKVEKAEEIDTAYLTLYRHRILKNNK